MNKLYGGNPGMRMTRTSLGARPLIQIAFMIFFPAFLFLFPSCQHTPQKAGFPGGGQAGSGPGQPVGGNVQQFFTTEFERLMQAGRESLNNGNFDAALQSFRSAAALEPNNYAAPHWAGHALINMGRFEESITAFRQSNALREAAVNHDIIGRILVEHLHRPTEGLQSIKRAYALDPNDPIILRDLAAAYLRIDSWDLALQAARAGLEKNPSDEVKKLLQECIVDVHLGRGEYAEARALLGQEALIRLRFGQYPAGMKVFFVSKGGPADLAGIQANDLIVSLNGKSLAGTDTGFFVAAVDGMGFGSVARLKVFRDGSFMDFNVPVGVTPDLPERVRQARLNSGAQSAATAVPPSIQIDQLSLVPPVVKAGSKFDLRIEFTVNDSQTDCEKIRASAAYAIVEQGKTLFEQRPVEVEALNGRKTLRVEHITAGAKGYYVIKVSIRSGQAAAEKNLPLVIE
jgi:Tfp pilus assembly protein PilF